MVEFCKRQNGIVEMQRKDEEEMVRPERIELPTSWFVAKHSIQLSYGRVSTRMSVRFLELYRNQNDSPNFGIPFGISMITEMITKF
jgi:hypothetical protein